MCLILNATTSCRYLTAVRLAYNQPQGQISPEIVMMTPLSFLSLSGNNLSYMTGAIRILTGCKNLIVLILSSNFMNEAMPNYDLKKISDVLQNLQAPDCGGCELIGPFPLWLCNLRKLQVLGLSGNQITGSIPRCGSGNYRAYSISTCHVTMFLEYFPKELGRLQALQSHEDQLNSRYMELPLYILLTC